MAHPGGGGESERGLGEGTVSLVDSVVVVEKLEGSVLHVAHTWLGLVTIPCQSRSRHHRGTEQMAHAPKGVGIEGFFPKQIIQDLEIYLTVVVVRIRSAVRSSHHGRGFDFVFVCELEVVPSQCI